MKNALLKMMMISSIIFLQSCTDDDTPEIINEEEIITTVLVNLTGSDGVIVLSSVDLDGDGPIVPTTTVSGNLVANATYQGTVQFLNQTESPAENITEEVEEESNDHQVFFTPSADLGFTTTYTNFDDNGDNLGTTFTLTTGDEGTGTFTVTLRHEPSKPNAGLATAGGETDVEVSYTVTVE